MSTVASDSPTTAPLVEGRKSVLEQSLVIAFMIIPVVALVTSVTLAWGWGITLLDVVIATIAYFGTGLGVTVGFHRHFTHKSFKATRPMKVALAITGSLAFQGSIVSWVADHRRHHAFSDKEGDPHSPWLFGTGPLALVRGFWHAHMGWLFDRDKTNARRFAPDLLADRDVAAVDRQFVLLTHCSAAC
jgi:stearoyl-CoA desaturase (delta-9 desaturase)